LRPRSRARRLKQALGNGVVSFSKRISRGRYADLVNTEIDQFPGLLLNLGCGLSSYQTSISGTEVRTDIRWEALPTAVADAHSLPFRNELFDAVLMENMLHNCQSPQQVIAEARRVIRVGGKVILTLPFLFPIISPWDRFRFTRFGVESLLTNFSSVAIEPQYGGYGTFAVLLSRLVKEKGSVRYFSPPVLAIAEILRLLDPVLTKILPISSYSSGYFVVAVK